MSIDDQFKEAIQRHPQEARSHFEVVDPGVWRVDESGRISGLGEEWMGPFRFVINGACYDAFGLRSRVVESQKTFLRDVGVLREGEARWRLPMVLSVVALSLIGCLVWKGLTFVHSKKSPAFLIHRWSFNKSLLDSATGGLASCIGDGNLLWNEDGTALKLTGGAGCVRGVLLGKNVIPTDGTPFTVEVWATHRSVRSWSRIFEFGTSYKNMLNMCWTAGDSLEEDRFQLYDGFPRHYSRDDKILAPYGIGVPYHISMVVEPNREGDGFTHFTFARRDTKTGAILACGGDKVGIPWNIRQLRDGCLYLGTHNQHPNRTSDAVADYDEVRIWRAALSEGQLSINAKNGPDELPDHVFVRKPDANAEANGKNAVDELFALAEKRRMDNRRTDDCAAGARQVPVPSTSMSAEDMYKRGMSFKQGDGCAHDFGKAFEWFMKGASLGNAAAQLELGEAYEKGRGVARNDSESAKWYLKAGSRGNALACLKIGECYADGRGVNANNDEAVKWFRKGAELGNAHAGFRLGSMYEHGSGVTKDMNEAEFWYKKSAGLGNSYAAEALRRLH